MDKEFTHQQLEGRVRELERYNAEADERNQILARENNELRAELEAGRNENKQVIPGKFYYEESGSEYEIKDEKFTWGLAYGEDAAIKFMNALNRPAPDAFEKAALELIELIDNMHKPEYACFFIAEPATDEDNQMNGYELATKYREILGIPEP